MSETGDDSTEGKDSTLTSLVEQCLGSVRRLASYAQEAQRDGSFDLAEFFRRAQAEARGAAAARTAGATSTDAPARRENQRVTGDQRPASPSHDQIAERAFAIYQREGGDDTENWERAERELMEHAGEAAKREPDPPAHGES